ncbi:MAG TPA: signal recognition particle-docking protein FtsY [Candidatus Anaerobiospirillum pullistercoris]|uniref:Signal recognition particle receptor FtsY n=1 Tax=Candidatus Anaerobiospirillum pullistercoris TaxID=2838452 RepID=A0A9D1WCH3_9GAMM|nr:signal recognition particle-docking protein FtsY [Candidatus Anaerobiospirillum pullistercoris]
MPDIGPAPEPAPLPVEPVRKKKRSPFFPWSRVDKDLGHAETKDKSDQNDGAERSASGDLLRESQAEPVAAEAKPVEAEAVEAKPTEAEAVEAKPEDVAPAEAKPAEAAPAETKPAEAKAVEAKPAETEAVEVKPEEVAPAETKPVEAEAVEAKPEEAEPAEAKPLEAAPVAAKPKATKSKRGRKKKAAEKVAASAAPEAAPEISAESAEQASAAPVATEAAPVASEESTPAVAEAPEAEVKPARKRGRKAKKAKSAASVEAEAAEAQVAEPQAAVSAEAEGSTAEVAVEAETTETVEAEAEAPSAEAELVESEAASSESTVTSEEKQSFFSRLKRSRDNFAQSMSALIRGRKIDDDLYDELETDLLTADLGGDTTYKVIDRLREESRLRDLSDAAALRKRLKKILSEILDPCQEPLVLVDHKPFVILMVGVNGAGKTTTIGKLARKYQDQGYSVMLAAGDTFRAAAVEQLKEWGERANVPVIAQATGSDSASVIFDAVNAAYARNVDVLICDTAGRLQNKDNLMDELRKIVRVMKKIDQGVPHEVLLVLDGTTGQNAVSQVRAFKEAVNVSGLVLTKLDGSAKGGVVFTLADLFQIPIRYVGIGEKAEDLREFKVEPFVDALIDDKAIE